VLLWLGVLTWLPFVAVRIAGGKPSFLWYLPVHLLGVLSGSRLRSHARKAMGAPSPRRTVLRTLGHGLTYLGILVWGPYFYLKLIAHQKVDVVDYLPYHLTGIVGGNALLLVSYIKSRKGRAQIQDTPE
jgi:hypothetical protein